MLNTEKLINNFLEQGADINAQNIFGFTPLMLATILGNDSLVKKLIDKGADIDILNTHDETAAHLAYQESQFNILKMLINQGTDTSLCSFTGLCLSDAEIIDDLKKHNIIVKPLSLEKSRELQKTREHMQSIRKEGLTPKEMREKALSGKLSIQIDLKEKIENKKELSSLLQVCILQKESNQSYENGWTPLMVAILIDSLDKKERNSRLKKSFLEKNY